MSTRRVQKVAEAIREVVSMSILTELQDPRDPRRDGHLRRGLRRPALCQGARLGDGRRNAAEPEPQGLQSAAGFLQAKIADRIDLRYTPRLSFLLDQGVKNSIAVAQILREVLPADRAVEPADEPVERLDAARTPSPHPTIRACRPRKIPRREWTIAWLLSVARPSSPSSTRF